MPMGPKICIPIAGSSEISTSIILSSNSPFSIFLRILSRVRSWRSFNSLDCLGSFLWSSGNKISRIRSFARSSAISTTSSSFSRSTIVTAVSIKSRIMDSTSLPTYPTSVNLLASTLIKGALERDASRLAISVFPTPVGPIMIILLGMISSRSFPSTCCRRHRFLSAIATAFFAFFWATIYRSNFFTICRGVNGFMESPKR